MKRHLSFEGYSERLAKGLPIEWPIEGTPVLHMMIKKDAVGLRVPRASTAPSPKTGLEHVVVRSTHRAGAYYHEVLVTDRRLFSEAYPVLLAIADRIQLEGLSLDAALHDTLRLLGRLLTKEDAMSPEKELGLFGELLFLEGLLWGHAPETALAGWRGFGHEEHDFGIGGLDIEVKSTSAERRVHWIGSLTQLVPSPGRPLWLVSYQLTGAGPDDGRTLGELISSLRSRLPSGDAFDRRLEQAGWRPAFAETNHTRWRRRSEPAAYRVLDGFPVLTPDLLTAAGVDLGQMPEVKYRIDLSSRLPEMLPEPLASVLTNGGST